MDRFIKMIMRTGYIYKITSPTNRIYIGRSFNIDIRFKDYRLLRCKTQPALYNSLKSYGFQNHNFQILLTLNNCDLETLKQIEVLYIRKYDSYYNGLNCTPGGEDGFQPGDKNPAKCKEFRQRKSQKMISEYKNGSRVAPFLGKKRSDDTKEKIKYKRMMQEFSGKPIRHKLVINTETGIFYNSLLEASQSTNLKYKTFLYRINLTNQNKFRIL